MPTIQFRGEPVEVIADPGQLDLDAAEILESELGLDLRDISALPKVRMIKTLTLVSVRRVFPDATMAEVGRLNLMELVDAISQVAPATPVVEPAAPEPREVELTGTLHVPLAVTQGTADGQGEVLSPSSAGSEQPPAALSATVEGGPLAALA